MGTDVQGTRLPWVEAIAESFPWHDFDEFHTSGHAALHARNGALVVEDLVGAEPLAFRIPGGNTYTWTPTADGISVAPGDMNAGTLVELDADTFSSYLNELLTASGCWRTGRASMVRGTIDGWRRWEPSVRTLLTGRHIYSEAVHETLAGLDLTRRFRADDDREEMRHFLATAGYLHIKGVYSADEVAVLGAEVEAARAQTTPGDPFSWWSINAAGEEVVTRINYLGRYSDVLQQHCFDPRMTELARLGSEEFRVCDDRLDGPMVFVKSSNVVKGDGDLGWHVDDGIGGHPVLCPLIQVGIQLDYANAENGQLMVLAGSHRYAKHALAWGAEGNLPLIRIDTEPGDVTLHFGDIMHSTPPPTGANAGRRALYYKFSEERTFEWVPPGCHYNDALFRPDAAGKVSSRAATYGES